MRAFHLASLHSHACFASGTAKRAVLYPRPSCRRFVRAGAKYGAQTFPDRDVLPVPIKFITVGKGNSQAAEAMSDEWEAKVRRYTKAEHVNIKSNPKNAGTPEVQMQAEAAKLLKAVGARDFVVALDERGQRCTSFDVANVVATAGDRSAANLVFIVGGPFGLADTVRQRADAVLRLSDCVLNHQVARVVLLEQLYRAWTIIRREPYHH